VTLEVKKKAKTVNYGDSHYEGCRAMVGMNIIEYHSIHSFPGGTFFFSPGI